MIILFLTLYVQEIKSHEICPSSDLLFLLQVAVKEFLEVDYSIYDRHQQTKKCSSPSLEAMTDPLMLCGAILGSQKEKIEKFGFDRKRFEIKIY